MQLMHRLHLHKLFVNDAVNINYATGYIPQTSCIRQNLPKITECIGYFGCTTQKFTLNSFFNITGNLPQNAYITMDLCKSQ